MFFIIVFIGGVFVGWKFGDKIEAKIKKKLQDK